MERCRPFLISSRDGVGEAFGRRPLGLEILKEDRHDPQKLRSGTFIRLVQRLNELTFAPLGMQMPNWVFYDCMAVPGGIFGFGSPAAELPPLVRDVMQVPSDYEGLVPLSLFIAIPMLDEQTWHNPTLCALNEVFPGAGPAGLMLASKATGLLALGVGTCWGACQWRSSHLDVHARFGPLDLMTAWTPAHSNERTLTYRFPATPERIDKAFEPGPPSYGEGMRWIDCDDDNALRELQAEIESGKRMQIVGPPVEDGAWTRAPIREMP
jgi:hypothetical protein